MEECGTSFGGIILDPNGVPQCCLKLSPTQREKYIQVLTKAWEQTTEGQKYRKELLTFPEGQATDWIWYEKDRPAMLARTRKALEKYVNVGADEYPVVLSEWQFTRNVYRMMDARERVLQLPNNPAIGDPSFKPLMTDKSFLAFSIDSHICGM